MDVDLSAHLNDVKPSVGGADDAQRNAKSRVRNKRKDVSDDGAKRRCVSTACIACRRRKSKCDGNTPTCAACASVYNTECVYDPNSDHRRKGVYKKDIDNLKTRNSTLQTLIQAILNYPEEDVPALVTKIRTCESLDAVAESILAKESGYEEEDELAMSPFTSAGSVPSVPTFENQLSGKMGELQLEDGSTRYIGGTSNLIHVDAEAEAQDLSVQPYDQYQQQEDPIASWTAVTNDTELILHLMNMYFTWHYTFFTTLSKSLFNRDFLLGLPPPNSPRKTQYCTPLLVNAMLALGCHFTSWPAARSNPDDSATAGDHFFKEAKRLIMVNDEHEKPKMTTVQALALMSVREAGCGREAKGWVYSGMSFRMACDLGLNLDSGRLSSRRDSSPDDAEEDARRITFWGCFLFDKCWSNYLGRLPQLSNSAMTVPKFDVFPMEESDIWSAYTDSGYNQAHAQPSRTRAVALQISKLCEISSDLMLSFYNPIDMDKVKGKQAELKKLSELHQRLETWRRELPKELEPREGGLPSLLVMHMFFQILFIHLFRPFLKYNQATSPLPAHVSPRKLCTQAAQMISKLLRLYKRSHGLRQICNVAVYIAHSACTIHLLNLPEKNARRDIIHGVKALEEIAEGWLCARRTLVILSVLSRKWKIELPEEAATVLVRTDAKFGTNAESTSQQPSPAYSQDSPSMVMQQTYQQATTRSPPMPTYKQALPPTTTNAPAYFASNPQTTNSSVTSPTNNPNTTTSANTPASGGSPSDLFGGVEQLLRDSQDWWLRDQSQLAVGFDNWNLADGDISWLNAGPRPNGSSPNFGPPLVSGTAVNGNAVSAPSTTNETGYTVPFGTLGTYNEDEWYQ